MLVEVVNLDNKVVGEVTLNEEIYALPVRDDVLHMMVRYQLAKKQSGNHKAKVISEISGTTKKPWKQKGTGRARQGSLRSPQFRGGAVALGPVVRSHAFELTKKFRKLALKHALSSKNFAQQLLVVDNLKLDAPKTKLLLDKLSFLGLNNALFVSAEKDEVFTKACANIIGVDVIPSCGVNVYDILRHNHLVIAKDALPLIEERLV